MREANLVASFEVKCYGSQNNQDIVQLIIHDNQVVAQAIEVNGHDIYGDIFDYVKGELNRASIKTPPKVTTHKTVKSVKKTTPKKKVAAKKVVDDDYFGFEQSFGALE